MQKLLVFIAGTKGGVGKSFAAMMMASAALDLELPVLIYDTDNENRTVSTMMKEYSLFLDEASEQYPLDSVINSLFSEEEKKVVIVDMKAGTSRTTQEWFSSVPWNELKSVDLEIFVTGCLTSDPDSVKTFVPWLEYFRKIDFPVHYLLIKNEKDGELFFTSETLLEPIIQKLKLPHTVFVFPAIEQEYINSLNNHGVPLREHYLGNAPDILNTIMQRSRMRNHYYSITDPIVMFYAQRMEKTPETPAYLHAKRRTALRKGEIRDKRYTKEEYTPKTEKGN